MPSAYNPNVAQVNLNGTYLGEEVQNTLWFTRDTTPITQTQLDTLAGLVETWWDVSMQPIISTQYTLRNVTATDWTSAVGPVAVYTTGLPLAGTNVNTPLAGSIALCTTFRTAGRGRSSRGRNYVCGLTENTRSGNNFTTAVVASVVAAYQGINTAVASGAWRHIVYSQETGHAVRAVGLRQDVSAYTADDKIDSMRRRLAGRGR